ncbi:MAG TPA: hypothetical protein VJ023_11975, partial [Pyrinomonadaceae bacterium]|nr:hypothetical protein [Pyrinomonadaceae bacterium]
MHYQVPAEDSRKNTTPLYCRPAPEYLPASGSHTPERFQLFRAVDVNTTPGTSGPARRESHGVANTVDAFPD